MRAGFQTQKRKAAIVANYWWIPNAALCNSSQMHFRVKVCCRVKLIPWHQFGWGHFLPRFLMLPSDSHMCWIIAWNYSFFHTFQMCTHAKIKPRVMHQAANGFFVLMLKSTSVHVARVHQTGDSFSRTCTDTPVLYFHTNVFLFASELQLWVVEQCMRHEREKFNSFFPHFWKQS